MSKIKQGYKQTKVGIIPEDWEVVRLGDICKFYKGKGISKENLSKEGTPCIRYGELYTTYNEKIDNVISKTNVDIKELFLSKSNDIIVPASGETAIDIATASCVLHDNIALSGDLNVIRTKENGIFLSYYLNVVAKHRIASIAQGVSVVHLYSSQLENLFLSLPPLKEQDKIAEILTTWDEAITKQTELLETKELQKKALMQKLLSGEARFRGFSDESRKKDDNCLSSLGSEPKGLCDSIPVGWEEVRLGEIGEFKTSSIDKIINENERLVNLINYMDVYRNKHIDQNFKCSETSLKEEQYEKVNLKKGDILFTPSSETPDDIGHSAVIIEDLSNTVYSYHLVRFRPKKNIDLKFSGYVFNNADILKEFAKRANGSTRFTLSIKDFNETKAKLPSLPEQQKIAEVLSLADDEINLLKKELEELKIQKNALMQKLLTGQVRVKI